MPCTLTHPTLTILQQILLIVIGGLLALVGALLASLLQIRREHMMLDREDQRAEAERSHAHYGQSIQEKRKAAVTQSLADCAAREDLGLHNQHWMASADRPGMPSDGIS